MFVRLGMPALLALCAVVPLITGCNSGSEAAAKAPSRIDPVKNAITINSDDEILWNGKQVTLHELAANLKQTQTLPNEPELQFVLSPGASYQISAKVLDVIKSSRVTKFGFVGNEKYATH